MMEDDPARENMPVIWGIIDSILLCSVVQLMVYGLLYFSVIFFNLFFEVDGAALLCCLRPPLFCCSVM